MTEERTQYTTDEVTQLRRQVAQLDERLDAALRTISGFTDASSYQWWAYRQRIDELEQTVARLEADNRRLRRLDSMPYWSIVQVANEPQLWSMPAVQEIKAWVDAQDGDA